MKNVREESELFLTVSLIKKIKNITPTVFQCLFLVLVHKLFTELVLYCESRLPKPLALVGLALLLLSNL